MEDVHPAFAKPPADCSDVVKVSRSDQHRDQADKHWGLKVPVGFSRLHPVLNTRTYVNRVLAGSHSARGAAILLSLSPALALTSSIRAVRMVVAVAMVYRKNSCAGPAVASLFHAWRRLPGQSLTGKNKECEEGRKGLA